MNKKICLKLFLLIILVLSIKPENAFGTIQSKEKKGNYPLPLPMGTITLRRAFEAGHYGHDLHLYHSNRNEATLKADPGQKRIISSCLEYGIPILSTQSGKVILVHQTEYNGGMGTSVIIQGDDGMQNIYMHMIENSVIVGIGEKIKAGQIIGLMGSTGHSTGIGCTLEKENPVTGKLESVNVSGVHLHFEIRTIEGEKKYAHIAKSFVGQEVYDDIPNQKSYISTTKMYDPKGYWNQFGYRYDYVLPEGGMDYSGTWNPALMPKLANGNNPANPLLPKLRSLTPLYPTENETVTYTITGERLPQNLELEFNACQKIDWLERTSEKQQFKCLIDTPGITGGKISIPNVQTNDKKPITMGFDVKVLARGESQGKPIYSGYPKLPSSIEPGDKIELSVTGQNLPEDLKFEIPFCQDTQYNFFGVERQSVRCQLGTMNYDAKGKIKNDLLTHDIKVKNKEGDIVSQGNLVIDHRIQIESITPSVAYFGQKNSFTLKGKGVEKLNTFHLDSCQNLIVLSSSNLKDQVVIQCTLPVPESFFSPLMPDYLKRKTLNLHIKDKPGGEMILAGKIEAIAFPETWVEKLTPPFPNLGEKTTFTLQGNHLPDKLIYWIANCSQGELTTIKSKTATFTCSPEAVGTNALKKIQIAALKATQDPEQFVKEIEKQRRVVEIKYPREYSQDGKTAITIYRENILPIPKAYRDLYISTLEKLTGKKVPNALWLDEENEVDVINYILKNQGDYSNTFLKKFGWKNKGSSSNPLYELMDCSNGLKNSGKTYGPRQKHNSKLNTTGSCATGLNIELIEKELEKMYPDKNEPPKK